MKTASFESYFNKNGYIENSEFFFYQFRYLCRVYFVKTKGNDKNQKRVFYSYQKGAAKNQCKLIYMQNHCERINVGIFIFNSIQISFKEFFYRSLP